MTFAYQRCYPEVHQEAACFEDDLKALKEKVDASTIFDYPNFLDNNYYYRLGVPGLGERGINVPIPCWYYANYQFKSGCILLKCVDVLSLYQLSTMIGSLSLSKCYEGNWD